MAEPSDSGRSAGPVDVPAAFRRLEAALRERPLSDFAAVGGEVAFIVRGAKPSHWRVTSLGGQVLIQPGNPPFPVFTIGIQPRALGKLAEGTLDVARAFREKRLVVEGDLEALGRFVSCFSFDETSSRA
ncbi:MAG: SCP2 sterol-binding domain-containing protein [Myxococcales bacterium]|nr:SCP2 sterol-binding domain-containing protein [Myxococcales bacterium]